MPETEFSGSNLRLKSVLIFALAILLLLVQSQSAAAQSAPTEKPEPDSLQDFDPVVKGATKLPGLFTFYRLRKGSTESIYLEIPESLLGRNLFLQATASTGTMSAPVQIFHGKPLSDTIFQVRKIDDFRVQFAIPPIQNRATHNPQVRRAVDREYPGETLATLNIKSRNSQNKSLLIDITSWLTNDPAQVGDMLKDAGVGYAFDNANGYIDSIKALPENAVIRMVHSLTWQGASIGQPQRIPFAITYNLFVLPDDGYRPRIGDARVGFMSTSFLDHSDPTNGDPRVNYIRRWHLEKADPSLALSPPKKPIVFYIDNAMPLEFREATRQGLLMWNAAFEKAGFKDAIVVKQMPDDADWDIADTRYNVVRWIVNNNYSTALVRSSELTGEIVGASINLDSSFTQFSSEMYDLFDDGRSQKPAHGVSHSASLTCEYPAGAIQNALFAATALDTLPGDSAKEKQRLLFEFIRESVAHEMGHCLGLRHNFMGSLFLTEKQLADPEVVRREGTTASVMDYIPENLEAIGRPQVGYYSAVVGRYDKWAIEYGYKPIPAKSSEEELPALRAFASRTNEPGLAFLSDEMVDDWDPEVLRYDLSRDPLGNSEHMYQIASRLFASLPDQHPKAGESYYEFTRRFNDLWFVGIVRPVRFALSYVGGMTISNNFRGDLGEKAPVSPVSLRDQMRALNFICQVAFSEQSPGISARQASMLAWNPNRIANQTHSEERLAPVLDKVSTTQNSFLDALFDPVRLSRIANNEYRSPSTLTLQALLDRVHKAVWSELANGNSISQSRRSLQSRYLFLLSQIASQKTKAPSDAVDLAYAELVELQKAVKVSLRKTTDSMRKAHLVTCLALIKRTIDGRP